MDRQENHGIRRNHGSDVMDEILKLIRRGKSERYVKEHCRIPTRSFSNKLDKKHSHFRAGVRFIEQIKKFSETVFYLFDAQCSTRVFSFAE
jgi:hypothetical protein